MSDIFTMDEPQPRLLDKTAQGVLGLPLDRPDGPAKVSGTATYAADARQGEMLHGVFLRATVARGRVTGIEAGDGADVLDLLTDERFLRNPAQGMAGEAPVQPDAQVHYHGQPIALAVAQSFEAARDAALRAKVTYADEGNDGVSHDAPLATETDDPETAGDFTAAFAAADVTLDRSYTTPSHVSAAMEPHATLAWWDGDDLTVQSSLQMLRFNKDELADALGIDTARVRILSPFVGGGFGSKLGVGPDVVAAALAAKKHGRPVQIIMSRQAVFDTILRRSETRQRVRLGATTTGRITAISHDDTVSNLNGEGFSEPTSQASKFLYGAEGLSFTQTVARLARTPAGSVRAPGEAVGMLAFEAAIDELAARIGMDPVELRLNNLPAKHPMDGRAYSARRLADCLREGASRFGWDKRGKAGSRREGEWMIGMGMASAARANMLIKASARVRLTGDRAVVETDMTDIGTGSYGIFRQLAAETLGLPVTHVEVRLGDSDLPGASGSGGSFGASSTGSAVFLAANEIRAKIAEKIGCATDDLTLKDGIARADNREYSLTDLIDGELVEEATIKAGDTDDTHFSSGFGAHFAEVAVNEWTGEVRVRRMLAVLAFGRVLNEKTARSQVIGGMIWGIGSALNEEMQHDDRDGHVVTRDLANYHVPSHLDVPGEMEVVFLEERDDHANPIQSKGVGELGISGAGAAVLNAVHNATGARLYDFPALPDRVIEAMSRKQP